MEGGGGGAGETRVANSVTTEREGEGSGVLFETCTVTSGRRSVQTAVMGDWETAIVHGSLRNRTVDHVCGLTGKESLRRRHDLVGLGSAL